MQNNIKKPYNVIVQIILSLLIFAPYVIFLVKDMGYEFVHIFKNDYYGKNIEFTTTFLLAVFVIILYLIAVFFLVIKRLTKNFTYISVIGVIAIIISSIYSLMLSAGNIQDRTIIMFVMLPIVFPSISFIILIDRLCVKKFGTKKVNKVEKIISAVISIPVLLWLFVMQIQYKY